MAKKLGRIEKKGGYAGGTSNKPVKVPTSSGATVNPKPPAEKEASRERVPARGARGSSR